ncbi:AraC family transcriptional regulator [Massilia sp. Root418]|uniref:AraC family transcriptional regulator n=1 Tax=Massilia sp. Root418 TaxID=1736532 RepID=UPI0006FB9D4A|nr:AraC family transcriptional regulator [Massilia sp. Root418]KQW93155.1 AraC family transcriptional regulator [Massilia sp. Root418]
MTHQPLSPHAPVTVSISFVHGLLSGLPQGAPLAAAALRHAGIAEELLQYSGARVTAEQYAALFRSLCENLDDECIGFLSRPFKRGSYALMAQSSLTAQDFQHAILRMANTFGILQDDMTLELVSERNMAGVALHFTNPLIGRRRFLHEFMLRSLYRLFDWLVGGDLSIARFDFAFTSPEDVESYSEFFTGPMVFSSAVSAIWFDKAQLQALVRVDETALLGFLTDPQTRFIVPRRFKNGVADKVLSHLHQSRPAWPDLEATAAALCMSAASLQRHLAKEGTTFQAIKDRLRRDMAITYLNTTTMSLSELADRLGFSESAGFQRAFKAWTGSAPGSYRRGEK